MLTKRKVHYKYNVNFGYITPTVVVTVIIIIMLPLSDDCTKREKSDIFSLNLDTFFVSPAEMMNFHNDKTK